MMSEMRNKIIFGAFVLLAVGLSSCQEKLEYDFPGDEYNRVYVKPDNSDYAIVHTPVGSIVSVEFPLIVRCNKAAAGDIKVNLALDNTLADSFNAYNGTSYATVAENMLTFKIRRTKVTVTPGEVDSEGNSGEAVVKKEYVYEDVKSMSVIIPAGSYTASDTLVVSVKEEFAPQMQEKGYVVPISVESCDGSNARLSTNLSATNFNILTSYDLVNVNGTTDGLTLVSDQSGWSATSDGKCMYTQWGYPGFEAFFDGDAQNFPYLSGASYVITDMGQEYEFYGIRALYEDINWSTWDYEEYASLGSGVNILISSDGSEWESIATLEKEMKDIVLYASVKARYLKFEWPSTGSRNIGIINIWQK